MAQPPNRTRIAGGLMIVALVGAGVWYFQSRSADKFTPDGSSSGQNSSASGESSNSNSAQSNGASTSNATGRATGSSESLQGNNLGDQIENGRLPDEAAFTRAQFFKPVNWGPQNTALAEKEKQTIKFKPACRAHPRATQDSVHPADWAESFTHTDPLSRWPAPSTHVVDWNQFWQLGDKGLQVSIRWNFESPPRYTVVGYSFALNNPDGYGTSLWPEKPEMTWDDAKAFVTEWEKKTLENGGKLATRSMSVAEKPFNPAEVSTEEIERAEYSNSRIRAVQSGKMVCNNPAQNSEELSCSCWF